MTSVVTAELLERYDTPGPRYTSYPTAVEFHEGFGPNEYERHLAVAAGNPSAPLSLYVHLPFCSARCSFCGCHTVITNNESVADAYLDHLELEVSLVAERLGERRTLVQYHWGGGTPTYHAPQVLARLHEQLLKHFKLAPGAEVAVEVDPRVTTVEHLAVLHELGFNRLSMGVQDADSTVQQLIGRNQDWNQTASLFASARELGFGSINVDLIYGLPGQTPASFATTLELVTGLRPDRLAVYSFAYVPWVRPNQKRIDPAGLPSRDAKYALLSLAIDTFVGAGYRAIGMDHFALPDDELALAAGAHTLTRTFMGYTTKRGTDTVALGSSGISDIAGAYAQNHKRLASYYECIEAGQLPIERGYELTADDLVRRDVITELMCNGRIEAKAIEESHGIDFDDYFGPEITRLTADGGPVDEGLAVIGPAGISATELGRTFIRNIAMVFDAHLGARTAEAPGAKPAFSRTV